MAEMNGANGEDLTAYPPLAAVEHPREPMSDVGWGSDHLEAPKKRKIPLWLLGCGGGCMFFVGALAVGADGLRGELTLMRAARALAALKGAKSVKREHMIAVAPSALRHRLRRDVLDETGSTVRITRAIAELFG